MVNCRACSVLSGGMSAISGTEIRLQRTDHPAIIGFGYFFVDNKFLSMNTVGLIQVNIVICNSYGA